MNKQSEAKASQNWKKKPDTCSECAHFKCDREEIRYSEFSSQALVFSRTAALEEAAKLVENEYGFHNIADAVRARKQDREMNDG